MIFLTLSFFCSFFNWVMDSIENEIAFNKSVFKNLNKKFWCKTISAHNIGFIKFTKYRPDAWHISKSLMIVSFAILLSFSVCFPSICAFPFDLRALYCYNKYICLLFIFASFGIAWIAPFNFLYNRASKLFK